MKLRLPSLLQEMNAFCVFCNESTDIQILLKKSLQKTLAILEARQGAILLLDQQTKELVLKASVGKKAVEKKKPVPCISSSLNIKNHSIGVINISDKSSHKPFTKKESQILDFISNQIALNCQRLSLAHQLTKSAKETNDLKKQMASQERLASLGKLAGGIAHEFNNPLDGVMRYNNLCLGHAQNDEVLREYLMEVQMGLKRMANIVKNLLACARQSSGSIHKVDIHKAMEQALKELYPYLASKNINFIKNLGKNIPEITDCGVERIISNLVKNAIDSISKNGTIEISTFFHRGFINLQISDTGHGIAGVDLDKIFEPFFTTKEIDQGCGLGLTVVNEIVKYYNGKIDVKSRLNKGTTFTVKLPVN